MSASSFWCWICLLCRPVSFWVSLASQSRLMRQTRRVSASSPTSPLPDNRVDIFSWFCSCCSADNELRRTDSEARAPTFVMRPPKVTCQWCLFSDCSATLFPWKPYLTDRYEGEESLWSSKSPEITSVCQRGGCTHTCPRVCQGPASLTQNSVIHWCLFCDFCMIYFHF